MPEPDKKQKAEAPSLRSLSPIFDKDQHGTYVDVLTAQLSKPDEASPRNIALTGHYGSGKSSVLGETKRRLAEDGVKVINLSLPSLSLKTNPTSAEKGSVPDVTNRIQKEIVKQLLYRQKPSSTPASRFNRLDTFAAKPAYVRAGIVGTFVTSVAILLKLPNTVHSSLPAEFWGWFDGHVWSGSSLALQWLSLPVVFVITFAAAMWAQQLLQQRHVTELAAGPAKVALSGPATSYFDEYLDEIVYFFQTSKTAIVIFEDLDRFEDPHIFETLRELNLLLNNAEQIGTDSICFVYAIRDSVFEHLDGSEDTSDSPSRQKSRMLISSNRTKFFDLVVPMVPFISHRTSRDLIEQELRRIADSMRPSKAVVEVVGAHLTDMRLIKNICNEYEIFQRRILGDKGLKELTPDRLFASIVYKNLYLSDYEKIRDGTSRLDSLYGAFRQWVSRQSSEARNKERQARVRLRQLDSVGRRSARLGTRLGEVLSARQPQSPSAEAITVTVTASGQVFNADDIKTPEFWRVWLETGSDITVQNVGNAYTPSTVDMSIDKIQTLLGEPLSPDDWGHTDRTELNSSIEKAIADQRRYSQVPMTDALVETAKTSNQDGDDQSMLDIVNRLFDDDDLVLELLRNGYIDENFTLYITQFPGQSISPSAMNFIIKAVQADRDDVDYHFGAGMEANPVDIQAVIDAEPVRTFSGRSVYNIEIFDYLLQSKSDKLDGPIRRLALSASDDLKFIDAYMTSGKQTQALVRRLSARWPGIFDYLIGDDQDSVDHKLLSAAFEGARPEITYAIHEEQANTIAGALLSLDVMTDKQESKRATEIAKVIKQLGIRVPELTGIAEPLRNELAVRNLYPMSASNLTAIFGEDKSRLPMDQIKSRRPDDVYLRVLDDLDEYLEAIGGIEDVPTVAEVESFTEILADVGAHHAELAVDVARRAERDCAVEDLTELDASLWPLIAQAHRVRPNTKNLTAYIDHYGIDESLTDFLTTVTHIQVDGGGDLLNPLAVKLLNAKSLSDEIKQKLVSSMKLGTGSIVATSLEPLAHSLIPPLVSAGLIEDSADSYAVLTDDEWKLKEAFVTASTSFAEFMMTVPLSQTDLFVLSLPSSPAILKEKVLDNLELFEPRLGSNGANGLAKWAVESGRSVSPDGIAILASKAGSKGAHSVVELLGQQLTTIDIDSLKRALNALSSPYDQLTVHGKDRPRVPDSTHMRAILDRLEAAGIVSKYRSSPWTWCTASSCDSSR